MQASTCASIRAVASSTDAGTTYAFQTDVAPQLAQASPQTNLDGVLLAGWKQTVGQSEQNFDGYNNQIDLKGRQRNNLAPNSPEEDGSPEGAIQTREAEHRQILDYFAILHQGPAYTPVVLSRPACVTETEVAMSAPSPLWKLASEEAVPVLTRQFNFHLTASTTSLPIHWCSSELVLLPKPGKNLCHPDQLRPINLWPIQAKLLGSILANRLLEYATEYLAVRSLVEAQHHTPHTTRQGKVSMAVAGGCGLAPLLWTIYLGLILKGIHRDLALGDSLVNTTYADDLHYSWVITSGRALEAAYAAMKGILGGLCDRGLNLSMDKTVVLMSLGGPQARACINRYTVQHPDTKLQIGYGKFEQQTFAHRLQLAKHTNTRLAPTLKCRGLPCKLRLGHPHHDPWSRLRWATKQGSRAVVGSLLQTVAFIAKSHSMFTRESNQAFAQRLCLPDPIKRLLECIARREKMDQFHPSPLLEGSPQLQWRELVRGEILEARATSHPQKDRCRVKLVQDVLHEQFRCSECDQTFVTQAALRRHVFNHHMTEEQQTERRQDTNRQLRDEIMEHARDGVPECRHCGHKFTTWHAFYYHINTQSCSVLRALKTSPLRLEIMPTLNDAVIENPSIVTFAGQGSWKDLALHVA
ncbi:unnamed protein product [Symbiodinium microadriaticum]|nr:unnamed protein product [Symbiodinium microadriaticum]